MKYDSHILLIKPILLKKNGYAKKLISIKMMKQIQKWYMKILKNNESYICIPNCKIDKISIYQKIFLKICFRCEKGYNGLQNDGMYELLSDPDDDVNYPLKINNRYYNVTSQVISLDNIKLNKLKSLLGSFNTNNKLLQNKV